MKFSVCIDAVFGKKDCVESIKTVKSLGFEAFEFWAWWNRDLERIRGAKEREGLEVAAICTKFISLVDAAGRMEYINGLRESIAAAKKLGCKKIITQVGNAIPELERETQHESLVEGLRECRELLESEDITLLVEPLNTLVDHKGYYLYSSEEGFQIIDEVGSPKVKLLYDIYHQQIMEGHVIARITENIDKIGHFHAAGNPGRHELDTGELNYPNIFTAIQKAGYREYLGLEYFPLEDPVQGLRRINGTGR